MAIGDELYATTLGQANFALFAYRSGVLSYAIGHIDAIEADMNAVSQAQKRQRKEASRNGVRHKRMELTAAPASMCVAYAAPCRVEFEIKEVPVATPATGCGGTVGCAVVAERV